MAKLLAGVLGWPVSHSLSPRLHGHWLSQLGIDGQYMAVPVEPENLRAALANLMGEGWQGCNLTIPHKEEALKLVDTLDETARIIGAVNTLVFSGGKIIGSNTDAYGFAENIRPALQGKGKAVVLGAGGAARAVCYALAKEGFAEVVITNRTHERAKELATHLGDGFSTTLWESREAILAGADLLVNTTSLGLKGGDMFDLNLDSLPETALVTDIVYAPLITPLLAAAQKRGNPIVDGLGMLIHQAVPGFTAWFGQKPHVDAAELEKLKHMLLS